MEHNWFRIIIYRVFSRKLSLVVLVCLFCFFLVGCNIGDEGHSLSHLATASAVETKPVINFEEVFPETFNTQDSNSENMSTITPEPPGVRLIPTPLITEKQAQELPDENKTKNCSPLMTIPIEELKMIISSPYKPPPPGKEERHQGVDFSYYRRGNQLSIEGQKIQSIFSGSVAAAISESFPYGNFVIIETEYRQIPAELITDLGIASDMSLYILYAHMLDQPLVKIGEEISACTILGAVGKSGNAGIPHLHLETRIGPPSILFEGMAYYSTQTSEMERLNYERWRTGGEFNHFDPMRLFDALPSH